MHLKEEHAQDCADRLAKIREQRAERDREQEERREILQAQEKERKEHIKLMTKLYGEGRSLSKIQQMLQMGFGS
jgi:hypothetical protein